MGKKYLDTKTYTLEASVMDVWENLEEEEQNFETVVREGKKNLDPVGQADGDIDNDGDQDKTDDYLKNRRRAIGRAMKGKKNLKANYGMMKANYGMSEEVEEVLEAWSKTLKLETKPLSSINPKNKDLSFGSTNEILSQNVPVSKLRQYRRAAKEEFDSKNIMVYFIMLDLCFDK